MASARKSVIVATNLHADIPSELTGALAKSLDVVPTGSVDAFRQSSNRYMVQHLTLLEGVLPIRLQHSGLPTRCLSIWEKLARHRA